MHRQRKIESTKKIPKCTVWDKSLFFFLETVRSQRWLESSNRTNTKDFEDRTVTKYL